MELGLSPREFADAFPFHIVFDRELKIVQIGAAIGRNLPGLAPGHPLTRFFRICRPPMPLDFDDILEARNHPFMLESISRKIAFKGQMLYLEAHRLMAFLCSPWVTNTIDLKRAGLSLRDFAIHDSIADYLFLLHTQNTLANELSAVNARLQERTSELASTNQKLIDKTKELEQVLDALKLSEAYNRAIVSSAADGIITIDRHGIIESANLAAQHLFGYAEHELVGNCFNMLIPRSCWRGAGGCLNRCFATGDKKCLRGRQELSVQQKGGSTIPIDLHISEVRVGERLSFAAIIRDLTEQKQAEARLKKLNHQLLDASRRAGMAEMHAGILHNVGNVLNSVNVSASLMEERLRQSKIPSVGRVANLLHEHADHLGTFLTEDEKGRRAPEFLLSLARRLADEQAALIREGISLKKNIDHLKAIVDTHQTCGRAPNVLEELPLSEIVYAALEVVSVSCERHGIQVIRQYQALPPVVIDRHKVLQILINLLQNAVHAVRDCAPAKRALTVTLKNKGDHSVNISVIDTGVGIPGENLARIFEHGFTTKPDGHGFGLHISAIMAREMGGSLTCHSDGPARGAAFTLELPLNLAERDLEE